MDDAISLAETNGEVVALIPEAPVDVGSNIEVLYDVRRGPLPDDASAPVVKIGYNRWESIEKCEMEKVPGKDGWYKANLSLPPLLFRVDFVIEDKNSGAVDNNNGQDFTFELDNAPSAEEVTTARVNLLDDFESTMQGMFSKEEDLIFDSAMKAAKGAAQEAKIAFIGKRREEILQGGGMLWQRGDSPMWKRALKVYLRG